MVTNAKTFTETAPVLDADHNRHGALGWLDLA